MSEALRSTGRFICIAAASSIVAINAAFASEQFATVETARSQEGLLAITSLSTGPELQEDAAGNLRFNGYFVTQFQATEITILIDIDGVETPPSIEQVAEQTGLFTVDGVVEFSPEVGDIELNKTIYSLTFAEDGTSGSLTLIDDPVPALGWLAYAGLASLVALTVYAIERCESVTLSASGDIAGTSLETSLTCEN